SIGIAGENRHGPLVVPLALVRVPRARVASRIVQQIELWIVRVPAPGAASSLLPPFTRPGLRPLAGLSIVRIRRIEVRRQQQLLVWAHAIGPPDLLTAVDVISRDVAAHPE